MQKFMFDSNRISQLCLLYYGLFDVWGDGCDVDGGCGFFLFWTQAAAILGEVFNQT